MTGLFRIAAAVLWVATATTATAQTPVTVQSGEHDGYTRLALTFGRAVEWEVTRTVQGYVLKVDAIDLRYDLSRVYQRIGRERLSSVRTDPESGALQIDVACPCHALPFEYRPGILVIDVRDGPAPPGSSFELGADGQAMAALELRAPLRPRERPDNAEPYARRTGTGYDWIALATGAPLPPPLEEIDAPLPAPFRENDVVTLAGEGMADLRRALLYDLARGAAEGAVELTLTPPTEQAVPLESLDQVEIRQADSLAAMIGVAADEDGPKGMTADGGSCITDDRLDIAAWADSRPVAEAIGPMTSDLYGEFDRVNADAAKRAIRYLLSLGFGAETAAMIRALGLADDESRVWMTMAHVLDGETDPDGAFADMAACDTSAALWSVLATPDLPQDRPVNSAAILRAFSDLPPHLRRHLGMALSDRMLSRGDTSTVRMVLRAMERVPGEPAPGTTLVTAGLDAATGEAPDLESLADLRSATGPEGAMATVALIRASLDANEPVAPELIIETEARLTEFAHSPQAGPLQQALAEAHATQGNFVRAFELAPPASPAGNPVWEILARTGGPAELLGYAVLPSPQARPPLPAAVRQTLARRLIDMGFAGPALIWTGAVSAGGETLPASMEVPDRLLSAEAELLRRNPTGAMRLLDGLEGQDPDALRLRALMLLDDVRAANLAAELGDNATEATLARASGAWDKVADVGPDLWRKAAAHATPVDPSDETPLAESRALLADSAAARADLSALLDGTSLEP